MTPTLHPIYKGTAFQQGYQAGLAAWDRGERTPPPMPPLSAHMSDRDWAQGKRLAFQYQRWKEEGGIHTTAPEQALAPLDGGAL